MNCMQMLTAVSGCTAVWHCCLQEWEAEQKRRQEALAKGWGPEDEEQPDGEAEGGPEDDLPFACYICRWVVCDVWRQQGTAGKARK